MKVKKDEKVKTGKVLNSFNVQMESKRIGYKMKPLEDKLSDYFSVDCVVWLLSISAKQSINNQLNSNNQNMMKVDYISLLSLSLFLFLSSYHEHSWIFFRMKFSVFTTLHLISIWLINFFIYWTLFTFPGFNENFDLS